ncbi:MAG TPA: hypothetical protein VF511_06985 [Chthoniobacterales bacterium]
MNTSLLRHSVLALLVASFTSAPALRASNPASGTIGPSGPTLTFDGTTVGTGVVSDSYRLTVQPGDYGNKIVKVKVSWMDPTNDYDLAVFKRLPNGDDGSEIAGSGAGIPINKEIVSIDPNGHGPGEYNIVINYFANTPGVDQPHGEISLVDIGPPRPANYVKGGITFSPNTNVHPGTAGMVVEPSSRVDPFGNYYISGIRGVPGGVDLWYFDLRPTVNNAPNPSYDPNMRAPIYRGMPDSATAAAPVVIGAGALGGGDIDIAVGFGNYSGPDAPIGQAQPALAYSSLLAASVTYGRSLDRGATFQFNPVGNAGGGAPVNDRQWMQFLGNNTVFLEYRKFENSFCFMQRSTDGGLHYDPAVVVGNLQQTGAVDVDEFDGTVYVSSDDGRIFVGVPVLPGQEPISYAEHTVLDEAINHDNLFFAMRVADGPRDGNGNLTGPGIVYCAYSDGANVFLVHSTDKGTTWSTRVPVNDRSDPTFKVNLFPWLETGKLPGSVGVVWYGTSNANNDDNAIWRVYYAQTFDATAAMPTFRIAQASDHGIHASNISIGGFGGAANRNLADYFQVVVDPLGAAVVGYCDDHNDFQGHTYVARQISGPSLNGGDVPAPSEGASLPANAFPVPGTPPVGNRPQQPMQPGPNGEQVTDPAQDQDTGLVGVVPGTSPVDIVSIKYQWQDSNSGPVIIATIKVSNLAAVPPSTTWRAYFTANAPETGVVGPVGDQISAGQSDDGNQFYVQLATAANPMTRTASWGTVARNTDGSLTTTARAGTPLGFINQQSNSVTLRINASMLNTAPNLKAPIGFGTVFCGLRGESFAAGGGTADATRGGTELVIQNPVRPTEPALRAR